MKAIKTFDKAKKTLMSDDGVEALDGFPGLSTELLLAIANGEVDAKVLASAVLACRGMDNKGAWIGFVQAEGFWKANK